MHTGSSAGLREVRKLSRVLEDIPVPAMIAVLDVKGSKNQALINVSTDLLFQILFQSPGSSLDALA